MRELAESSVATIMKNYRQFQQAMAKQREGMQVHNSSSRARQSSIKPCRKMSLPAPRACSKPSTVKPTTA
jgi:hypothetical protein